MVPQRFVILFHEVPPRSGEEMNQSLSRMTNHWDLMLEKDPHLETWSLAVEPQPGKTVSAMRLAPHRKDYLNFEGKISGNRGHVTRVLSGTWSFVDGQKSIASENASNEQCANAATSSYPTSSYFSSASFSLKLDHGDCSWKADFELQADKEWTISIERFPKNSNC